VKNRRIRVIRVLFHKKYPAEMANRFFDRRKLKSQLFFDLFFEYHIADCRDAVLIDV
jgi:hypothetical protein